MGVKNVEFFVAFETTTKTTTNKKIAPGELTPRATKTLILFYFIMAGVEGLEPPAPGFGDRCSTN